MNIYVATSWRNTYQPEVVKALRADGFDVYDFRNPEPGDHGFSWSEIDPAWKSWTPEQYVAALSHPRSIDGFGKDMAALRRADLCVLVMPSGRSAALEAGFAVGSGKPTCMYLPEPLPEAELMVKMFDAIKFDLPGTVAWAMGNRRRSVLAALDGVGHDGK